MDLLPSLQESIGSRHDGERPLRICVVGAGAGGLAALKVIKDCAQFKDGLWEVVVFEARSTAGGIWQPAPPTGNPPDTPLYDSLTTNLPHPVMAYSSYSFPAETPLFPPASTVLKYLQDYAEHFDLRAHIKFNTAVVRVRAGPESGPRWFVTACSNTSTPPREEEEPFDYLIVANGHYRVPRYPSASGLDIWRESGRATHSVYYRRPSDFGDAQKILVVGAGPSGQDLCADLLADGRTVVHSATDTTPEDTHDGRLKRRGRVAQFLSTATGTVLFEDGTTEDGIDRVALATGYLFDFPFLSDLLTQDLPPPLPPLPAALYNSTYHLFPLARHIFPLSTPALAFLGLPIRVAPLPLLEAQMRAVIHAFVNPTALDPAQEAVAIVSRSERLRQHGASNELALARAWHRFEGHEQFAYRDALDAFAGAAHRVAPWEIEAYDAKGVLRAEWRALERTGEADAWLRGVATTEQWVALMRRLVRRAEERAGNSAVEAVNSASRL